jgi:membrane protease YdiL (CAAX protease family)
MTPAFARYISPARAAPEIWRLVLGLVLIAGVHLAWLHILAGALRGTMDWGTVLSASTPGAVVALLAGFGGLVIGTVAAARILHRRGMGSLIGHGPRALRHFVLGLVVVALVYGVGAVAWLTLTGWPDAGVAPHLWLVWLGPLLLALLVQTGAEELIFRGYLQQQLAARFRNPLVWMVLPSLAFGMLHYEPAMLGENAWLMVAATGLFGLVAADLTARTGTLGLAWGLHFANNFVALALFAPAGDMAGAALFLMPFGIGDAAEMRGMLLFDMALILVVWALARFALVRGRAGG